MSRLTLSLMLPLPEAVQAEPEEAVQVQVAPVSPDGSVSVTGAPVTGFGPPFVATIVYVNG
jgi:hypothetical protein